MKNDFEEQLIKELEKEGVSAGEKEDYVKILNKITISSEMKRSDSFKRHFLGKLIDGEKKKQMFITAPKIYIPALLFTFLLFIFITEVVNAQKSLPGQPLYPVKILSERFMKAVNPSFQNEIIIRRSEEIKNLTEQKKNSELLKKTLDDYEKELESENNINSLKIEESKRNLEDARGKTEEIHKEEIENVIKKTEDKIIESHNEEQNKEGLNKTIEQVKSAQTSQGEENRNGGHRKEDKKNSEEDED